MLLLSLLLFLLVRKEVEGVGSGNKRRDTSKKDFVLHPHSTPCRYRLLLNQEGNKRQTNHARIGSEGG